METKEQLVKVVKEWVTMDNEIRRHQQLVKEMKAKQKKEKGRLLVYGIGEYYGKR